MATQPTTKTRHVMTGGDRWRLLLACQVLWTGAAACGPRQPEPSATGAVSASEPPSVGMLPVDAPPIVSMPRVPPEVYGAHGLAHALEHLQVLGEPSVFHDTAHHVFALRVLYLPSFGEPRSVRVESLGPSQNRWVSKRLRFPPPDVPEDATPRVMAGGRAFAERQVDSGWLDDDDLALLVTATRDALRRHGQHMRRQAQRAARTSEGPRRIDLDEVCLDGSIWLFELVVNGHYQAFRGPDDGCKWAPGLCGLTCRVLDLAEQASGSECRHRDWCGSSSDAELRPFSTVGHASYRTADAVLRNYVREYGEAGQHHFCVVGYTDGDDHHAWVHWREGNMWILWEPYGPEYIADPGYEANELLVSRRQLDIATDVVADPGTSTYQMSRAWAAGALRDCRHHGALFEVTR